MTDTTQSASSFGRKALRPMMNMAEQDKYAKVSRHHEQHAEGQFWQLLSNCNATAKLMCKRIQPSHFVCVKMAQYND